MHAIRPGHDRLRRRRLRRRDPEAALQPLETALRGAKAAGHVGQVLLRGETRLACPMGMAGVPSAPLPGWHVRGHSRLGAQHRPVTDGQMVREADLAGGDDAAAEAGTSPRFRPGHDDRVLADLDVVADLNEIVDLGPRRMIVLPSMARSIVVFAPMSTSSSITTTPTCRILR